MDTNPKDTLCSYDVESNTWKAMKGMPTPRYATYSFLVNEKLYVCGKLPSFVWPHIQHNRRFFTILHQFHTSSYALMVSFTDKFLKGKLEWALPQTSPVLNAADIYNVLLFTGGRQGKLPNTALECYDFTEDKWEKLPDIPSKRVFAMYTATDKYIFSIGGLKQPATEGFSDACEVFDSEKSKFLFFFNYYYLNNCQLPRMRIAETSLVDFGPQISRAIYWRE